MNKEVVKSYIKYFRFAVSLKVVALDKAEDLTCTNCWSERETIDLNSFKSFSIFCRKQRSIPMEQKVKQPFTVVYFPLPRI
jgi:hypothetical protein